MSRRFLVETLDLVDLTARRMANKGFSAASVRCVLRCAAAELTHHLQLGYAVRLPGTMRLWTNPLRQRLVRSNLPHLRGKKPRLSRPRSKLYVKPEGRLRGYLRKGLIDPLVIRRDATGQGGSDARSNGSD